MNTFFKAIIAILIFFAGMSGSALADDSMKGHDMSSSEKFGTLFHESMVDGYMLSYYLKDLREQETTDPAKGSHDMSKMEMDKPHHIMVYIMDEAHKPVLKGKVGFLIKKGEENPQKAMGMIMGEGFGATADMKEAGVYTIVTKAVLGDKKLMDSFDYEMK